MTTLEYALLIGGLIAHGTLTAFTWANRNDAKRSERNAADTEARIAQAEGRIRDHAADVEGWHGCLKPADPAQNEAFRLMAARDAIRPATDANLTRVNFDLPATLDPGGRTGEMKR